MSENDNIDNTIGNEHKFNDEFKKLNKLFKKSFVGDRNSEQNKLIEDKESPDNSGNIKEGLKNLVDEQIVKSAKVSDQKINFLRYVTIGVIVLLFTALLGYIFDTFKWSSQRELEREVRFQESETKRNERIMQIEHQISVLTNIVKNSEKTMDAKIDSALLEYMSNNN